MKQFSKTPYFIYMAIGVLYVLVKVIFVSFGYLHLGAIAHGSIPAILTVFSGLMALKERENTSGKMNFHKVNILFALLVLIITPLYMYIKMGENWLTEGRLGVLLIYEFLAVTQGIIAFTMLKAQQNTELNFNEKE